MAYNGAGVFTLYTPGNPVVTNTTISTAWWNNTGTDIATGLSTAICRDGQSTTTQRIPFAAGISNGSQTLTAVAAGTATTHAATVGQLQSSAVITLGTVAGTNTITAVGSPAVAAYAAGQSFEFTPAATNTGATTINIDGLGAKNIFAANAACVGGELVISVPVRIKYDGTQFQILGLTSATGTSASTFTFNGSGGTSGSITMTYQKIGKFVTLHIPAVTATSGTGSTTFTADTALPAAIRPASIIQIFGTNNDLDNGGSTSVASVVTIATSGVLTIQRSAMAQAWTNTATCGTVQGMTIVYFVG